MISALVHIASSLESPCFHAPAAVPGKTICGRWIRTVLHLETARRQGLKLCRQCKEALLR